jgi:hypothetical protein
MIFVFPGTGSGFQGLELAEAHELFSRGLGQEFATASFAHDDVNSSYQLLRHDNVSAFSVHASSPPAISKSHFKFNKEWEFVKERSRWASPAETTTLSSFDWGKRARSLAPRHFSTGHGRHRRIPASGGSGFLAIALALGIKD